MRSRRFALPMIAMSTAQIVALAIAGCACVSDVRSHRIPNVLTIGSFALALLFGAVTAGVEGFLSAVVGWLAGAAMLIVPFALGGMGAGDVKLLGAIGAWLGPSAALWTGIFATIAGGFMAVVVAAAGGCLRETWSNVGAMLQMWRVAGLRPIPELTLAAGSGVRLAYAIPILAGTVFTIWLR